MRYFKVVIIAIFICISTFLPSLYSYEVIDSNLHITDYEVIAVDIPMPVEISKRSVIVSKLQTTINEYLGDCSEYPTLGDSDIFEYIHRVSQYLHGLKLRIYTSCTIVEPSSLMSIMNPRTNCHFEIINQTAETLVIPVDFFNILIVED